jgi:hypothetical protein
MPGDLVAIMPVVGASQNQAAAGKEEGATPGQDNHFF